MFRKSLIAIVIISLFSGSFFVFSAKPSPVNAQELLNVSLPGDPLPEGPDFASLSLGNAWDMSEFFDISQYLNGAGRHPSLTNISVADGVFSARSIGDRYADLASFFPLFKGHTGFMQIGNNLGSIHPVNSQQYDCIYLAMKVNSPTKVIGSDFADVFRVNYSNASTYGVVFEYLYPENAAWPYNPQVSGWRLYKINLSAPAHIYSGVARWQDQPYWTEIQINPTAYKDIDFEVDWVRLTTCSEETQYQAQITWTPDANVNAIWVRPEGTARDILVASDINGSQGSYLLNTKGLAPGSYQVGMGTLSGCCTQWSNGELTINQTPLHQFVFPSPTSGEDFAASLGNAWDMDPSDIDQVYCAQASILDGVLDLNTPYPAAVPASCKGEIGEVDSRVILNMPGTLYNANQYRYLNFELTMQGEYAIPADGMIGRLIWTTPNGCNQVTADIPYEVGRHVYSIDLYDPFNGTPVQALPSGCPIVPWSQTNVVTGIRFDPNENYTGVYVPEMVFSQQFDWISLSKEDRVLQGKPYMIGLNLNKPASQISQIEYFFTTDLANPFQNTVLRYNKQAASPTYGEYTIYLPSLLYTFGLPFEEPVSDVSFLWDTAGIPAGDYYICVRTSDGMNDSTFCSEAPVHVYTP